MKLRSSFRVNFSRFSALLLLTSLLFGPIPSICYGGEIHSAVENRDVTRIKGLVRQKPSLLVERREDGGAFGYTALHVAAEYGYEDIVMLLLELGAEVNVKARNGETALITAIGERHTEIATLLLSNGADVTIKSNDGSTALHFAAIEDLREIAEVLIAKGAEINAPDENGITPLYCAAEFGGKHVATLLTEKGASRTALTALEFHSSSYGYSLDVPLGWVAIPQDVLQEQLAAVQKQDAKPLLYDAGFQLGSSDGWFKRPYVLVQVVPFGRQINDDEFEDLVQQLTGMDFGEGLDESLSADARQLLSHLEVGRPSLDQARHRFFLTADMDIEEIGPARSFSVGHFGRDSMVMIHFYSLRSNWDRYADVRLAIVDSFQFDPDKAYSAEIAKAARWRPWASRLGKGIGIAIVLAILAAISARKRRTP